VKRTQVELIKHKPVIGKSIHPGHTSAISYAPSGARRLRRGPSPWVDLREPSPLLGNSASPRPQRSISPPALLWRGRGDVPPRRCSVLAEMKSTRNAIRTMRRHSMISAGRTLDQALTFFYAGKTHGALRALGKTPVVWEGIVTPVHSLQSSKQLRTYLFVTRDGAQPQSSTPY